MCKQQISSFFTRILNEKRTQLPSIPKHLPQYESSEKQLELLFTSIPSLSNYYQSLIPYFHNLDSNLSSQFISLYIMVHSKFANFPSLSTQTNLQNELKTFLLSITSEIESILRGYQYELFPQNIYEYRIVIAIELLLELIVTMFLRYYPNGDDYIVNDLFTAEQIENDMKKLFIINCSLPWLCDIITAINYIYSISRCKLFMTSQSKFDGIIKSSLIKTKCIVKHFGLFNGIVLLIRKYFINKQTLLNNPLMNWQHNYSNGKLFENIHMNDLDILSTKLIEIISENLFMSYKTFEKDFKCNFHINVHSLNQLLLFTGSIYENMLYIKFKHSNYKVDFHSYFMWYYEVSNFLSDEINKKLLHYIQELFSFLKKNKQSIHNQRIVFASLKEIDYKVIEYFHNVLKDFLVLHMIASFNSDSFCDCFVKNEWMKHVVDTFTLISFFKSCYSVYIETDMKKNGMIEVSYSFIIKQMFELISIELIKNEVVFPLRLFIYKEMLIQNQMIMIDYFIKSFQDEFPDVMNSIDVNKQMAIVQNLKDIGQSQNPFNFYLAYMILRNIQPNNNDNCKLRFYISSSFPLDFYDIDLINKTTLDKTNNTNNNSMDIDSGNKENINSNIVYSEHNNNGIINLSLNLKNTKRHSNRPTINKRSGNQCSNVSSFQECLQYNNTMNDNNNSSSNVTNVEEYDISNIINNIDVTLINDIKDAFVQYENNNKKHIVSYVSNGIPLVVFQEAYGFRQCKFAENNLLGCLQERIGSKSYIENIFQCFLIGDLTGSNKDNLDATLKYFDVEGEMDYFGFIEQLKKIIV